MHESELPAAPIHPTPASALAYLPEAGGLVFVGGGPEAAFFDGATGSAIAAPDEPWGAYHVFAEPNPVHPRCGSGAATPTSACPPCSTPIWASSGCPMLVWLALMGFRPTRARRARAPRRPRPRRPSGSARAAGRSTG
jgi:hypothetical protein